MNSEENMFKLRLFLSLFGRLFFHLCAAFCFGTWMHSAWAGLFMFSILEFLSQIFSNRQE